MFTQNERRGEPELLIPVQIDLSKPMLEEGEEELLVEDDESVFRKADHKPLLPGEQTVENLSVALEARSDASKVSTQIRQLEKDHFNEMMHDTSEEIYRSKSSLSDFSKVPS